MSMKSRTPTHWGLLSVAAASSLVLAACGGSSAQEEEESPSPSPTVAESESEPPTPSETPTEEEEELTTLTVGALDEPHAEILEYVDENLAEEEGLDLEIVETEDYETANNQLAEGELDANYVQTVPTLDQEVIDHQYEFVYGTGVHIQPYVLFSDGYDSAEEISNGATFGITSEEEDQYRSLRLLESKRVLHEIAEDSTLADLTERENPRSLQFEEIDPDELAQSVGEEDLDGVIVNGKDFDEADLDLADAVLVEEVHQSPYSDIMVWDEENENSDQIVALDSLLHSQEVGSYILETWPDGEIIPPNRERLEEQERQEELEELEEQEELEELEEQEEQEDNS